MENNLVYYEYFKWLNYESIYETKKLERINKKNQLDNTEIDFLKRNEEYKETKELFKKYIDNSIDNDEEIKINQFMENYSIDTIIKDKIGTSKYDIYMKTVIYYKNYDIEKLNSMINKLKQMEEIDKVNDDEYITFILYYFRKLKAKKIKILTKNKTL